MKQSECEKCDDRGDFHGKNCIVRRLIFEDKQQERGASPKEAMEIAVLALQKFLNRDMTQSMSQIIPFVRPKGKRMSTLNAGQEVQPQPTKTLSPQPQATYFPSAEDWKMMLNWGAAALKSGMLPNAIKSPEAAAIIALKGRELGLSFMVSVAHIHVINGKPTMSAEMMQSLARRNLPGLVINILKSDSKECEIEFIRPERGSKPFISTFTIDDAKNADLLGKSVWKQYPAAMLFSRAVSAGLRKVCPEALMGVSYTPEEMGAPVDQEGNVIETTGRVVSSESAAHAQSVENPSGGGDNSNHLTTEDFQRLYAKAKEIGMGSKDEFKKFICEKMEFPLDTFLITDLTRSNFEVLLEILKSEKTKAEVSKEPLERDPLDHDVPWAKYRKK